MPFARRIAGPPGSGFKLDDLRWLQDPPPSGPLDWCDVSKNAGYRDYSVTIRAADLRAWHERDRHKAFEGVYAFEDWRRTMTRKTEALEEALSRAADDALFTLTDYEWESGMD